MSKYRTWFLIALLGVSGYLAATPSAPTELSLRGIVDWVIRGGHIASSTGAIPSVGTLGERYIDLSNPFRPVEKRSDGAAWRALWTWDHALLTHLRYAESGHGIVPVTHGGTGASSAAEARTNLSVYSKSETDDVIVGSMGLLRYYVQQASTGSDISGYGYLQTYANPINGASASYNIFYMTPTQLFAEVSASGTPEITVSKAGVYPCFLTGARSGLLDVALLATAWKRTVAGVETQIASSSWVTVATSSSALISLPMTAVSEVVWDPTDRVVFKLYGERTGDFIGTSTLSLYFGESYPSYFTFNVGREGAYARRDLSNVDPEEGRTALDAASTGDIPNNASFSFDLLSDSPDYTGNGGKVLALNSGGTELEWVSVPGIGSLSHAGLSDLDFESSGHTGFTGATETASITSTLQAVMASVSAELDPANYQENYDIMASASALIAPLSGRTYVGIQNIDELKSIHIYPNGLVASSGPANLVLYAGEVWYQRLTDSVPVAFYASEATPIVVFQGK